MELSDPTKETKKPLENVSKKNKTEARKKRQSEWNKKRKEKLQKYGELELENQQLQSFLS